MVSQDTKPTGEYSGCRGDLSGQELFALDATGRTRTPAARRILQVASELFYGRGIHAVGVEAIAEAAGVTKKTLYDQYGSKEALVAAYLTVRDNSYRRWVTSRVCDHSDDGVRRLLAIFDALDEWMGRQPRRGCAFINAFAELPESGHSGRDIAIAQKTWLRGYFAELATDAGLPQPEVLADQLLTLHEGAIISYSAGGQDYAAATAKEAASILIAALGAPIDKTYGGSWSPPAVTNG